MRSNLLSAFFLSQRIENGDPKAAAYTHQS